MSVNNGFKNLRAAIQARFTKRYNLSPPSTFVDYAVDNNFPNMAEQADGNATFQTFKEANASNVFEILNGLTLTQLATPGAPVITHAGTAGVVTWTYKSVARGAGGVTAASAAGSTTTGNATLTAANYNIITFPAVPNATSYDVYRTVAGTTPSTLGLIANVPATQAGQLSGYVLNDTALAGDASTAPTANTTGSFSAANLGLSSNGTATATAGAATLNTQAGTITTESLVTAAGATYTLTLTDARLSATSILLVTVGLRTATTGQPAVASVVPAAGSATIAIQNIHASAAFNGTLRIAFVAL